jgi:hypothetical protein
MIDTVMNGIRMNALAASVPERARPPLGGALRGMRPRDRWSWRRADPSAAARP